MKTPARMSLEGACINPDFVDLTGLPNVRVDLRYGTTNNVLARDVYGGFQKVLLHQLAAKKFAIASKLLAKKYPSLCFLVFDALRPQCAQREFWELVKGTAQQSYFADPGKGSAHSFGFAIDLGLLDSRGQELDMGTAFDDLSPLAEPQREQEWLVAKRLSKAQVDNRLILRGV
ncbi:MAG: M15 family metallopeptidase, partial [Bdellovibrionota bacterium]